MTLHIRNSGILSTVQDLGRTGYRRFGVNPNGVTDTIATRGINILLGNNENDPVLEMHFPAGEFEFEKSCAFAVGGAEFSAELDGISISNWQVHISTVGSVLRFTKRILGTRAYLGVRGGFNVSEWFGSSSTNLTAACGGFEGRRIHKGDRIGFTGSRVDDIGRKLSRSIIPIYSRFPTVRIIPGPEFDWLVADSQKLLESESFSISNNSNRMGYRLSGEPLQRISNEEMMSSAVTFGTIQLLPDGQLIVLMSDHQTTGGYPRIANVITADLPLLAQIGPSDGVGFHMITSLEAEEILLDIERDLNLLKIGCMFS
jgi:antagonist of KipI